MNDMRTKENTLVSVITPCFNADKTIVETIESILAQSYRDIELIVIDDCSIDSSFEIANEYSEMDPRVKVLKLDNNSGVSVARNTGIKASKGRFLAFCDSDDIWYPDKLEKQLELIFEKNAAICFSSYDLIDTSGEKKRLRAINKNTIKFADMLYANPIGNLTGLIDTSKVGRHFQAGCRHEDYLMWIELLRSVDYAVGVEESLAGYRVHGSNLTRNKLKSLLWHYQVLRHASIRPPSALWYTLYGRLVLMIKRVFQGKG